MTLTQLFTNIANAIRAKTGSSEIIKAENFPTEIADITTGTDTSDANATANDIVAGKTAYVNDVKLTGTYTGIVPTGTINITENGAVDVSDYASANVNVQGSSSTNNAKILPFNTHNRQIQSALQSFEPIDISSCTVLNYGFYGLRSLITLPYMDFSHITDASSIFSQDESLVNIPVLNFQSLTGNTNYNMFQNCRSLSNESLNNILATCITMTRVTNKTLKYMGITSAQATTCQSLSNWNDFVAAGWTTGY